MNRIGSLRRIGAIAAAVMAAGALVAASPALSQQQGKLKVGLMLPYTGTYAALGNAITNGFKLAIEENGGKVAGREIEYFVVDDESDPAKAPENANKLIKRDNVDVMVGTVHSGVALAMSKVARDNNTLLIIPNAGADDITGPLCAANVFRTSFSNSQLGIAMGKVMADQKKKTAVTITWKYSAGEESIGGFKETFEAGGGKVVKELFLPFPQVEFQPLLTEIAALKPDVYAMQGYDAAQLLIVGMNAVKGDTGKRAELVAAMGAAKLDSPRGSLALNKGHNPIHDIYLRKVEGKENKYVSVAIKNLTDPPRGCKL